METMNLIIKTLFGAIIISYIIAIPVAFRMAFLSKKSDRLRTFPWLFRFLLAWFLYPIYIVHKVLN